MSFFRPALKAILLSALLFVSLHTAPSFATQKFRVTSAHPLNFVTSGTKYITVQRLTSDSLTVYVNAWGSKLTFGAASLHWNTNDTSTRTISVAFSSTANDTTYGGALLYGDQYSDTTNITAWDTAYTRPTTDFSLYSHSASFACTSDSATITLTNHNLQSSAIRVLAISSRMNNWTINHTAFDSNSYSVPANSIGYVYLTYHRHGVTRDTTCVYFYCSSPYNQYDSIWVYVHDSTVSTSPSRDFSLSRHITTIGCNGSAVTTYLTDTNVTSTGINVQVWAYEYNHWSVNGHRDTTGSIIYTSINANSANTLSITYYPHGVPRDSMWIVFVCQSPYTQGDTAWIYVTDSSVTSPRDFSINAHHMTATNYGDSAGRYTTIHNYRTSAISIMARTSANSNWTINNGTNDSTWFNVSASGDYIFPIVFHPHGVQYDTCTVYFYCSSPYQQWDTVTVIVWDSTYVPPSIGLRVSQLASIYPGDTSCAMVTIWNKGNSPASINSIGTGDLAWPITGRPLLPRMLGPGDSIFVTLCHRATRTGIHSAIVAVGFGSGSYVYDTVSVYVLNGLTGGDTLYFDDVPIGSYADMTVPVAEHGRDTVSVTHYWHTTQAEVSLLSPNFPKVMQKGDTAKLHFHFRPDSIGRTIESFYCAGSSGSATNVVLIGRGVGAPSDTMDLFKSQSTNISMVTQTTFTSHTFYFQNPLTSSIVVTNVDLTNSNHFVITGISPRNPPPDTLASGAVMGVDLLFNGDTNGLYRDTLVITTEGGLQSWYFNIQATKQGATSAVLAQPHNSIAVLNLSPNPAWESVTIHVQNAERINEEVFDLLGNRIAQVTNGVWNVAEIPSGNYIVRATGIDSNGEPFVISKRLAIVR